MVSYRNGPSTGRSGIKRGGFECEAPETRGTGVNAKGFLVIEEKLTSQRVDNTGRGLVEVVFSADSENAPPHPQRIVGLDAARAIAIAGMALIHFAMVLSSSTMGSSSVGWIIDRLSGRPATLFMILAGIGVSLRWRNKVSQLEACPATNLDQRELSAAKVRMRGSLLRRGLFFLVFGYVNLLIWPGDILRVYGIAYLMASFFLLVSSRWLGIMSAVVIGTFVGLMLVLDFETNWDFSTLEYANLWTVQGSMMNLFFNGFRAVLPWTGIFLLGMLIGRCDLHSIRFRQVMMLIGMVVWLGAELVSLSLLQMATPLVASSDSETLVALVGTESLPAMPLFLLSSSGTAMVVIMGCIQLTSGKNPGLWQPIISAGQLAFTWYMLHIAIVILVGVVTEFEGTSSMLVTFVVSLIFCDLMFGVSWWYRKKFRAGPLEWVLRSLT